jgi:hypothetical protein
MPAKLIGDFERAGLKTHLGSSAPGDPVKTELPNRLRSLLFPGRNARRLFSVSSYQGAAGLAAHSITHSAPIS